MIGNDIVDFADPAVLREYLRPRFIERICNPHERAAVAESARPGWHVCALFAAKEAAYKAAVKCDTAIAFAHARFAVSARFDHVTYGRLRLRLRILSGHDWVHAVAWVGCPSPLHAADGTRGGADSSIAVRALLADHLGRRSGRPSADFAVIREERPTAWDGRAPPVLRIRGIAEPLDVSVSHDGRMVAFAAPRRAVLPP